MEKAIRDALLIYCATIQDNGAKLVPHLEVQELYDGIRINAGIQREGLSAMILSSVILSFDINRVTETKTRVLIKKEAWHELGLQFMMYGVNKLYLHTRMRSEEDPAFHCTDRNKYPII